MSEQHLTEEQVQQYAENEALFGSDEMSHVHHCEECQSLIASYRLMFSVIEESESPAFDFDVSAAVLSQIAQPQQVIPGDKFLYVISAVCCVLFAAAGIYFFNDYLSSLFEGISKLAWILVLVSVVAMVVFLASDNIRKYNRKINQLDIS